MIEFIKENYGNIIVILILILVIVFAFIQIRRNSGKCLTCKSKNNCPFVKKDN